MPTHATHGGSRAGAGRPKGRKNAATLAYMAALATLPATDDLLQWFLNVMCCEVLTLRVRVVAAAMPYLHPKL